MDTRALLQSISSLEQRKEQLVQELDNVSLELRSLKAAYARKINEDVLIYRLPSEILSGIFMISQQYGKHLAKSLPFQVIASHVSGHWRQIVLCTPLLWNDINLHIRPMNHVQGRYLAQLEAYLKYSYTCFLDITLHFHVADNLSSYLKLLGQHSTRWRRLSIITRYEPAGEIYALLHSVHTPRLEHLSLNIGIPAREQSPRTQFLCILPTVLSDAPSLSFVRLAGLALGRLHPPISKVTTLHLDGWTRHYLTQQQFKTIFDSAPGIVNLSLNQLCVYHPRDPLEVVSSVRLPDLRYLRIRGPCSLSYRLLSLLEIPQLYALTLHNVDIFDSTTLPDVQSLTLDSCAFEEPQIRKLIRLFPSITSLSIDESLPDIFSLLDPNSTASKAWPQLETISVRELQWSDISQLCTMVINRMDGDKPLKQIRLDRRSRTALRTKQRLDLLQKLVRVDNCDFVETWPPGLGYEDGDDLLE
jgi:F-box-like